MKKLLFILMIIPFLSVGQTKIRNTQLTSGNQPAGKVLTSDGSTNVVWGDAYAGTVSDATTTTKGIIQLAGDLSGTSASPTVPGLTGKEDKANKENTTVDNSTTKYPTVNLLKTYADTKEPVFTKNTAFNKNFGTTAGTVLEGRTFGTAANSESTDFAPSSVYPASGLTTGYLPYKTATVLANSAIWTDGVKVGIGTTSPTAVLHLKAGTATASTAPLKFTSGVLLTNPEAGAVEFDGTHFYGTVGTTRYQIDQQSTSSVVDATTIVKGLVKLAGDLGGTADLPTVPALSGKEPTITVGTTSQYWRGDKSWQTFPTIPTTTSQLTNNSGFLTGYSETDPNIYAWAKASSKPSYAYSEITGKPTIPTYTSQLTNNSGFITGFTETDPNIYAWAKSSIKPSYSYSEITGTVPSADGNYYPTSLSYSSGTLTLGRSGLSSLTASLPISLPASDVYSWAKASSKPSYTAAEVGAASAANEGKVAFNGNHSLLGYLDDAKFDIVGAVISPKTTSTATSGSTLPITSGGVYSALGGISSITTDKSVNRGSVNIGGLIIQWGKLIVGDPGSNQVYTITYPISFPNYVTNIQHTLEDTSTGAGALLHETYSYNTSSCSIRIHEAAGGVQNATINWVAFGW